MATALAEMLLLLRRWAGPRHHSRLRSAERPRLTSGQTVLKRRIDPQTSKGAERGNATPTMASAGGQLHVSARTRRLRVARPTRVREQTNEVPHSIRTSRRNSSKRWPVSCYHRRVLMAAVMHQLGPMDVTNGFTSSVGLPEMKGMFDLMRLCLCVWGERVAP
jgi:hypothetical protein